MTVRSRIPAVSACSQSSTPARLVVCVTPSSAGGRPALPVRVEEPSACTSPLTSPPGPNRRHNPQPDPAPTTPNKRNPRPPARTTRQPQINRAQRADGERASSTSTDLSRPRGPVRNAVHRICLFTAVKPSLRQGMCVDPRAGVMQVVMLCSQVTHAANCYQVTGDESPGT